MSYIALRNTQVGAQKRPFVLAGAPTNNTTLLGVAGVGDLLNDTTNGVAYICTATNGTSTITWTKVGTQT